MRWRVLVPEEVGARVRSEAYEYRPEGRLPWLQRLCFWVVGRLGCVRRERVSRVQVRELDVATIFEAVLEQASGVLWAYGRDCKYVLLGQRQMLGMGHEVADHMLYPMDPARVFPESVAGLQIVTVPWLRDGIICLPDLNES